MLTLLRNAQAGVDPSFLDGLRRPNTGSTTLLATHTKIGLGPLKSGAMVASEGTFILDPPSGRQFLVVQEHAQNLGRPDGRYQDVMGPGCFLVQRRVNPAGV